MSAPSISFPTPVAPPPVPTPAPSDPSRLYTASFPAHLSMGMSLEKRPDGSATVTKVIPNSPASHGQVVVKR